jgi:UDP-N-acetyl-2-amino-2-deoxyglucuronate dehydrogenase
VKCSLFVQILSAAGWQCYGIALTFWPLQMTTHIGLVGGGNISETHARAARAIPDVEISAIFGTNAEKVGRLCREYGGKLFSNFDEFLAHRPMELVAIGSPSGLHADQGIAAARRGLHARVKWYRPPEYYSNSQWRGTFSLDGGGALINQAVHTLDLMLWIFGEVKAVQALCKTALHAIEAEDTLIAMLEFANGALGVLQAATSIFPGYPRRLELTGSEGTLTIEQDRLLNTDLKKPHADLLRSSEADKNLSSSSPTVSDVRGHQAVLEDFLRAIRTNTKPRCDGQEGRTGLALVQMIYEACRTGKRVSAEPKEDL